MKQESWNRFIKQGNYCLYVKGEYVDEFLHQCEKRKLIWAGGEPPVSDLRFVNELKRIGGYIYCHNGYKLYYSYNALFFHNEGTLERVYDGEFYIPEYKDNKEKPIYFYKGDPI